MIQVRGAVRTTSKRLQRPKLGRPLRTEGLIRQDQFLDHCLSMFMKAGYRNVTIDQLALSFGISKSTIYFIEILGGGLSNFLGNAAPLHQRQYLLDQAVYFFCRGLGLKDP